MKKQSKFLLSALLFSAGLSLAMPGWAQRPTEQGSANAAFITGGVGDEEAASFKAQRGKYNLRMTITGKQGEFLASLPVKIYDSHKHAMLDTLANGPLVYVKLPAGTYEVHVGSSYKHTVHLGAKGGTDLHVSL